MDSAVNHAKSTPEVLMKAPAQLYGDAQDGDLKKAQDRQRANKIKTQLKTLLKKIDSDGKGLIRLDAF